MAPLFLAFALLAALIPSARAYENEAQKLTRLYTAERTLYMQAGISPEERAEHYAKALQLAKDADAAELKSGAPEGEGAAANALVANLEEVRQIVVRDNPPPPPKTDQPVVPPVAKNPLTDVQKGVAAALEGLMRVAPNLKTGGGTGGGNSGAAPNGGLAAQIQADPKAALKSVDAIVGEHPDDPRGLALRSSIKASLGDEAGAAADAKAALKLDPKNQLAKLVYGYGDEAAAAGKRGAGIMKGGFESRALLDGAGGQGANDRFRRGGAGADRAPGAQAAAGAPPAAAPAAPRPAEGFKLTEVSPFARQLAAGRRCLSIGDAACAVDEATGILKADPADRDALLLRASAFNRLGRPQEALADADAILARKPEDIAALLERGYAKYQLGRFAEALVDVETALKLEPLNAMGHLYRGMILEKLDRGSEAVAAFLRAVELDPALKPLADEALFRLRGGTGAPPAGGASRLPSNGRLALWGALAVVALGLLIKGVRRAVHPELHTPMTPLR